MRVFWGGLFEEGGGTAVQFNREIIISDWSYGEKHTIRLKVKV